MLSLLELELFVSSLLIALTSAGSYPHKAHRDVIHCLTAKGVPYADQSSANWTALSTPFNLRLIYEPAVITIPETPGQVSKSVICAAAAGLKVQAKGGGHSYASFSSGGKNGSMIIDMENFSSIAVDQTTFIAKIGSGQRLGNIALALYSQGERALPHGTCPGVGVGGHALHGGYGYDSRKWGLALDHIVGLDVVLANGTYIYTNETSYPDIFFAMRGAGDSFGIVTYLYFQTESAPSSVLYFTAGLTAALQDIDVLTSAFQELQNYSLTSPDVTSNITFGIYTDSSGSLLLRGWCMQCNLDVFQSTVFPAMLQGFPSPSPTVTELGWIDALAALASPDPLAEPLGSGYTLFDTFYAKSLVVKNEEPLTTKAIRSFWSYILANQGKGPFFSIINLYGGPTSQINVPSPNSSAYSDRDALWVFQNYGYTSNHLPPYDPAITQIIDGLNDAVTCAQPNGDFTAYLNYVDPDLSPRMAAELYYGPSTYDRLLWIKADVDPGFLFWNPQAVGTSHFLPLSEAAQYL